jgi:hypothetical protein
VSFPPEVIVIWSIDHAINVVRQLRAGASQQIKGYKRPEHEPLRADLEQARGALLQAECCLIEAHARLEHRPYGATDAIRG